MGFGCRNGWVFDCERSLEEDAGALGCGSCGSASARAGNGWGGDSHHNSPGLSHFAGFGREGVAAAWAGRDRGRGKAVIFNRTRMGWIEGRNEVWRSGTAVPPRGEGRDRTYAES